MKPIYKLAAILAGIACMIGAYAMANEPNPPRIAYKYEMCYGDTVYNVCASLATPKDDINKMTWETLKNNHIEDSGAIQPGQVITIYVDPVKAEAMNEH